MRVLFTCVVGAGHFNPMVPLARALQDGGHEVAVATDPSFVEHVRGVGFEAFPSGLDMADAIGRLRAETPGWDDIPAWDRMRYIVPGLFAGIRIEPMLADLATIFAGWAPNLLIHDSAEMAGAIAAERADIAHAEHSFGVLRPIEISRLAIDALEPVCARLGVRNPGIGGLGGELYLDICPPGIQRAAIAELADVQPLRPMGFDDAPGFVDPAWLDELPPRPTVYATMGTEFNKDPRIFETIIDGLEREPLNVVVTVGPRGDPTALRPRPDNVRIERFIPQSRLLTHCSVFISHGGSGALMGGLNAGVPMLAIPQGADQFLNAEVIDQAGIGRRLLPAEFNAGAVREATRALIEDRRYADAVRSQRAAIEAMPTPAAVVPVLEALV